MRATVLRSLRGLSQADPDYLYDPKANTIGAMLMHLAATDVVYQDLTFNNLTDFSEANKAKWSVAMDLGDAARQQIKGNNADYYLNALNEVREKTKQEFKQRDDAWLMTVDPKFFGNQPTNNYCNRTADAVVSRRRARKQPQRADQVDQGPVTGRETGEGLIVSPNIPTKR